MVGEAPQVDKLLRDAAVEFFKNVYNAATNQVETVKVSKKRPRSEPIGFKWNSTGPRPNNTFRGARRNKGRNERNTSLKWLRKESGRSRSQVDALMASLKGTKALLDHG